MVYNFYTNKPERNVEILITTNNLKKSFLINTDDIGKAQVTEINEFCEEDTLIFRVRKKNYITKYYYHICNKNNKSNVELDFYIALNHGDNIYNLSFEEGTEDLDSNSNGNILLFLPVCEETLPLQILMKLNYGAREKNGLDLSIKRANKIINTLMNNGWKGDEFYLQVKQSDYPHVKFEIIGNYVPKRY